ncbi:MAG: ABC transporter ATP-binding protein [Deltaproteobacteria bacterium]|nr:ABC transporter ATP-binding protein [Deltaproteobacteria bacterium]
MIHVKNLSKEYSSGRGRIKALSDVSIDIEGSKTVVVIGKSGSGKTTLLNCIGGLEKPDRGSISCFGVDINALSGKNLSLFQREKVGFVFQQGNLISYLNVFDNIDFPLALNGINGKKRKGRVLELLDKIGLAGAGKALPFELSGGEIQRVSFARAIAHSPKMLLADEPTASLDSETGRNLIKLMHEVSTEHKCIMVISTHDLEITELANVIIQLRDGMVIGVDQ